MINWIRELKVKYKALQFILSKDIALIYWATENNGKVKSGIAGFGMDISNERQQFISTVERTLVRDVKDDEENEGEEE